MLLEVDGLSTAYQGLLAIQGVSLDVAEGEIVVVAGANGAGKSTLLKSIAGLERPRDGTVRFDGGRLDGLPGHLITARGVAYVPENKRLFPRLSVACAAPPCLVVGLSPRATSPHTAHLTTHKSQHKEAHGPRARTGHTAVAAAYRVIPFLNTPRSAI